MAHVVDPGSLRDVLEMTAAVVLEQHVAAPNSRHEQILIAVVVDVGKRRRDAYPIRERDARFGGDVPELAAAEIFPELVSANLVHEIDVFEAVAIDVGDGNAGAVVVVHWLVISPGIVDRVLNERDAALFDGVPELKLIVDLELSDAVALCFRAGRER